MTPDYRHGKGAHIVRRLIHISMALIPWIYYWYGVALANFFGISVYEIVLSVLLLISLFELLRLHKGWVVFGQRSYEAKQLSAVAWGSIGIAIVLLFTPKQGYQGAALGAPLIWSLALVDPLLGELRRHKVGLAWHVFIAWLALLLIWGLSCYFLGTPLIALIIIPVVTILGEWPNLKNIDDNFLMLIIPWIFVIILYQTLWF